MSRGWRWRYLLALPATTLGGLLAWHRSSFVLAASFGRLPLLAAAWVALLLPIALTLWAGPRRWTRLGAALGIAAYAAVLARPAVTMGWSTWDALGHPRHFERVDAAFAEAYAAGRARMRAEGNPEAAALRALRHGDTRFYAMDFFTLHPMGIAWTPAAEERYGMKEMPGGGGDIGPGTEDGNAYLREASCWVFRYDSTLVHHLTIPGAPRGRVIDLPARAPHRALCDLSAR